MDSFFSLLKVLAFCGTAFALAFVVLLALPHSKLRSVCMEFMKYLIAGFMFLLVPSPIDVVPDVIPGIGWVDDFGYIAAGIAAINSGRRDRRKRQLEEECEAAAASKMSELQASWKASEAKSAQEVANG